MKSWSLIAKIVFSQMWHHPGRPFVTIFGVIASTCAVVWVVSSYDALVSQFDENAQKYLGRYDALIVPVGPPSASNIVSEQILDELQNDVGVLEVNPVSQSRVTVTRVAEPTDEKQPETTLGLLVGSRPPVHGAPPVDPLLVGTPATSPPYELIRGEWLDETSDAPAAVLGVRTARNLNISVGDRILVTSLANQIELPVIGLIDQASESPSLKLQGSRPPTKNSHEKSLKSAADEHEQASQPDTLSEPPSSAPKQAELSLPSAYVQGVATHAIYVRPTTAEQITGFEARPTVLQISLRDTVTPEEFQKAWGPKFAAVHPPLQFVDFSKVREGMTTSRSVSSQRSQAWAATGMASLAPVFVILSTLSMGVTERNREFAMLRAIGLTRLRVGGIIAFESLLLAGLGWAGGLLTGAMLISLGNQIMPGLFNSGVGLGWTTIMLSLITVLAGALGAAILPVFRVMRIAPIEAMSEQAPSPSRGRWIAFAVIGLGLACLAPVIVFLLPIAPAWRVLSYSVIAYPALLLGMVFLTPTIIRICERWFSPVLSTLFQLDSRLLDTQLSSNMWRTVGATLALTVGLGLYTSTQVWGYSMLQPFLPGGWMPDILVAFHPVGVDDDSFQQIENIDGVKSDEVLPVSIEQPRFRWPDGNEPDALKYDNAVLFGVDPRRAIGGSDPLFQFHFVDGDRESAARELEEGGACLVSEDFRMLTGIGLGDQLSFQPPNLPEATVNYRIAGVISLPGWHWITKFSGVRRHHVRTAAMIFANRDDVKTDFHLPQSEFFWLNKEASASLSSIEADLQNIAESNAGTTIDVQGFGSMTSYRPFARVTATETVDRAIRMHAEATIWGMSKLPIITLAIMSLAVANAMIASVRARTWEFGVMRAIGLTRWQVIRLILAETVLIGLAACLLSLAFGIVGGWSGVGMARYGGGFFAGPPPLLIPWKELAIGFGFTLSVCLIAGLWPALRTVRTETLSLLRK
ncbi:FtsX-like permease family protein [Thalassoglobus neptunius]|uniref:FtsX-like permease family protein n=1 Tax=Thalassoglobus neptunius TaxID=1938619 RepID=A0A5C5W059_9PLAN|nr:ABC transporter permease [Thalassoglobus neptunius]TWT43555.1 FtsX-like permease family protein [Thalassoglobus neptunius]